MKLTGECFCGDIRYEIDGGVFDARSCHCSRCRKAFSSAGSAYALAEPGTFRWVAGESLLTIYTGQHGAGLAFCSKCGTTLAGTWQGNVHGITLGTLNGNPDIRIARHIFVGSKAHWDEIGGDAPQFDEDAT